MEAFKKRLDDTKAVSTSNVIRIRELEDLIIQRDGSLVTHAVLFEKQNKLNLEITELKKIYLRIKDYEFEGGSAPRELYLDYADKLKKCEYEDELIFVKRNQLLNTFETLNNDAFLKYFGAKGKLAVYDVEQLKEIVQKSANRANDLKTKLRDRTNQELTKDKTDQLTREIERQIARPTLPQEPLVLVSRKNAETLEDKTMIMTDISKNIKKYGLRDGLRVSNAALLPESLLMDPPPR